MEHLSKYIENTNFILWVFEPNSDLEAWWNQFGNDHPEEKRNIQLARKVLLKFRTSNKKLSVEEKIQIFTRVLIGLEEKQLKEKTMHMLIGILKYAAVALLFFSIGALLFYKQNQFDSQLYSQKLAEPISENTARLIRATGHDILMKENKSILEYQADGKLVVNNDTVSADLSVSSPSTAMNQLIIPYGKTSEVLLCDGTKVFLNAGSRLVYPESFSGKAREVFLVGEAFFDVKHDRDHPFIVQLNDLRIKVLGTRFNVSAYPSDNLIETVLAEGKVRMEKNNTGLFDKATDLVPNQMASFDRTTLETNVKIVDTNNYILWTKGLLQFKSTDLYSITKRLERFYNIRFQFSDPSLEKLSISGKMELKEDKDEICERISKVASVTIVKKNDGLYEIIK